MHTGGEALFTEPLGDRWCVGIVRGVARWFMGCGRVATCGRGLPVGLWVVAGVATCGRGLPVGLWVGSRAFARWWYGVPVGLWVVAGWPRAVEGCPLVYGLWWPGLPRAVEGCPLVYGWGAGWLLVRAPSDVWVTRFPRAVEGCVCGVSVCACVCVCLVWGCLRVGSRVLVGRRVREHAWVRGRTWGMGHARVRCDLVCCAAAMPLARVSNFSLARSVVAWRMRVMARHCLATIAGYLWQSSGAFVIVLPTATDTASECILTITNMTAERGFSCRKLDCLSRQCTGFAAMQGCNDDSPDFQLGVHTPLQPLAAVIDGQVVPEPAVAGDGPDLIYGRPRARSCNIA